MIITSASHANPAPNHPLGRQRIIRIIKGQKQHQISGSGPRGEVEGGPAQVQKQAESIPVFDSGIEDARNDAHQGGQRQKGPQGPQLGPKQGIDGQVDQQELHGHDGQTAPFQVKAKATSTHFQNSNCKKKFKFSEKYELLVTSVEIEWSKFSKWR